MPTMTLTKATLDQIQLGGTTLDKAIADGTVKIDGNEADGQGFPRLPGYLQVLVQHRHALSGATGRSENPSETEGSSFPR